MENEWTTYFPKEPGRYWFYGYMYGKISCGRKQNPELILVDVHRIVNGLSYIANGQFMYKSEVECAHFKKFEPFELPNLQ